MGGSLTAGLVLLFTTSATAAAPTESAKTAPVQRPAALEGAPPGDASKEAPAEVATPEAPGTSAPDATAVPDAPADASPIDSEATKGSEDPDQGSSPAVDPSLLEGEAEAAKPVPSVRPTVQDDDARDTELAREYEDRYRPEGNPGRFNLGVRALFANAGGGSKVGGRMGGAQIDAGQSWNRIGYALTGQIFGGRVFLPDRVAEMNMLIGGGPTLNMGRMALLGRGYLDLRVGYDFFYAVVNQQREDPTVVATQGDPNVVLEQAENLAPHGPRVNLNMGLLSHSNHRRFIHGFGLSMGYQALVGSFRGDLPFTHMLTLGLSYWMG